MSVVNRVALAAALVIVAVFPATALAERPLDRAGHHSLRAPVTDQNFYFVMADRFENGSTANDNGGLPPGTDEGQSGLRPDRQGLVPRRRPRRPARQARLHQGPRDHRHLAHAELQEQGGPGQQRLPVRPATTATGSPTSRRSTRTSAPTTTCAALVDAAHARGIKVYFDIITNHTADVIRYQEGAARPYISKDRYPYRTPPAPCSTTATSPAASTSRRSRRPGQPVCPPGDPLQLPLHPCVPAAEQDVKVPAWLNDVEPLPQPRQHDVRRRELAVRRLLRPRRPVHGEPEGRRRDDRHLQGMDPRLPHRRLPDGHDEARRRRVLAEVRAGDRDLRAVAGDRRLLHVRRGRRGLQPRASSRTTRSHDDVQGVLDFLFQMSARRLRREVARDRQAARLLRTTTTGTRTATPTSTTCRPSSATTTAAGSACSCATTTRARARTSCSPRDRLAHELMYFSRGNPVVYYGDEQGFTGAGGDQDARQDMFPSQTPQYNNLGPTPTSPATTARARTTTSARTRRRWTTTSTRRTRSTGEIPQLARVTQRPSARCATAPSSTGSRRRPPGVYAFSRISRSRKREYVVALNNAEQPASASIPTFVRDGRWEKVYGDGPQRLRSGGDRRSTSRSRPLSAGRLPREEAHPAQQGARRRSAVDAPATGRDRLEVSADVERRLVLRGDVLRQGRQRRAGGTSARTTTRRTACSTTSPTSTPGTRVQYRAVVLDNADHTRASDVDAADGRAAGDRARGARTRASASAARSRCARPPRRTTPTTW